MKDLLPRDFNCRFDHAALKSSLDQSDIVTACWEAGECNLYAVAVNPTWVAFATRFLQKSQVKVCSVVGFPLGASRTDVKLMEAAKAAGDGAVEIDMVANIGWLASGEFSRAEAEIRKIRDGLPYNVLLKVIIEAPELTEKQQQDATRAVINSGAQFVKTGTGFYGPATVDQVRTLHQTADGRIQVKAAGGIKTLSQCRELLQAGADRLGSSSSVRIVEEWKSQL
ncbi:MAG TPA: deoxyribose-phosphate aldolase [Acidobacteriota bacterium]|nr:deoxyribose-phosphate aldolase [Acidobacteriota bacterium]